MIYSIIQLRDAKNLPQTQGCQSSSSSVMHTKSAAAACKVFTKQDWSVAKTKMFDRPAAQYVQMPEKSERFRCFSCVSSSKCI